VDAALSGMILPFVAEPDNWNFEAGADSISTSGHKMIGSPLPCGMVIARKKNVDRIARSVEYVGVLDTTLAGSRNAFTPIVLWYALKRLGLDGMKQNVQNCLAIADYAKAELEKRGVPAWRNKNSITVVFPRPAEAVIKKWQIAPFGDIGHLITMPHVTKQTVDQFVADYLDSPADQRARPSIVPPGSHAIITAASSDVPGDKLNAGTGT
jgi:histidine decarboxylase